jgi:hypothetical protein
MADVGVQRLALVICSSRLVTSYHAGLESDSRLVSAILTRCGFTVQANQTSIAEDGFQSFADLLSLTGYDIRNLAKVTSVTGLTSGEASK